jgi:hypothetical protein
MPADLSSLSHSCVQQGTPQKLPTPLSSLMKTDIMIQYFGSHGPTINQLKVGTITIGRVFLGRAISPGQN